MLPWHINSQNEPALVHSMSLLLFMYAAPADYIGSSFIASFTPSLIVPGLFSVMVSTNPDNALEGLEYFSAVLSVPAEFPDVLEGVPSVARVNITDATSKCLQRLSQIES